MFTLSEPKLWFPSSLCCSQRPSSQVPVADGGKRYLLFEGVVLGFSANPLFSTFLAECLLLWFWRKPIGSRWRGTAKEHPVGSSAEPWWKFENETWVKSETWTALSAPRVMISFYYELQNVCMPSSIDQHKAVSNCDLKEKWIMFYYVFFFLLKI